MKKQVIFLYFIFYCFFFVQAQTSVTNKGITITNTGDRIFISGDYTNLSSGFIVNKGDIAVGGDINNNGTNGLCDSSVGSFTVNGSHQFIQGTNIRFHKLVINAIDTLTLQDSVDVLDSLLFKTGYVHLNGNNIHLDSTGYLAETNTSHIYGESGYIHFKKYIVNPKLTEDIGGLGLKILSSNNHGVVDVKRRHYQLLAGDTSTYRFFAITPQYIAAVDSVIASYFDDEATKSISEESGYRIFVKKNNVSTAGWENRGGAANPGANVVKANVNNMSLDTILLTIASQNCALAPDINVTGYDTIYNLMLVGTITCAQDTLSVNAFSSAPSPIITWRNPLGLMYNNPLEVSAPNSFFIDVIDGATGCANSVLVNIDQSKTPPLLNSIADTLSLTCSQTTLQLTGNSPTPQTTLVWTDNGSFNMANPATVNTKGIYYLTATRADNGCVKTDSVVVDFDSTLTLTSTNDTLVCKNSLVNISTGELSGVQNISYLWNTGNTSATISVNPLITTEYIVTATSPGCEGKDTVVITIPPDLIDSVATFQPCDGTAKGLIQLFVQGGIPPYFYSIDSGATFVTTNEFSQMPYATYNTVIKDSLGCFVADTATLDGQSSFPIARFIASTKNTKGDTLILVDISSPQPDSVQWILPAGAEVIGGDMFNPIVVMPDTGNYSVRMVGYFDKCIIDTTKIIQFFRGDTTFATANNNNGIKSVALYPNPSDGNFTIAVEFYKKQNASIQILDVLGLKSFQQNFLDVDLITLPVSLPQLINGTYILRVIGEYNSKYVNFIISK